MAAENGFLAPDELASELRHGRLVVLRMDDSTGSASGMVVGAAEHCTPAHITFMAREARGLVCLGLERSRCRQLQLPLMVEGGADDVAPFTLSIEAAQGIDTGISAADRAHTVRTAVAADAKPQDLVQPGHIFPIAAAEGGVLVRADRAEAATDLVRLSGLLPAAVFTDVLDTGGDLASVLALDSFVARHGLAQGRVSDLVHFRLTHERTVERLREAEVDTAHGRLHLTAYRDTTQGLIHLALSRGRIEPGAITLVRVHVASALRDLVGTTLEGVASWRFDASLRAIAVAERGVVVLISKPETPEELLAGVDRLLEGAVTDTAVSADGYASVGLGAQILRDLGVGRIRLLGAPVKYNALSGFGLEVVDYLSPTDTGNHQA